MLVKTIISALCSANVIARALQHAARSVLHDVTSCFVSSDAVLRGCRCIPVRCDPACPGPEGVSVLLISGTGGGKGLVFPKARVQPAFVCLLK